MHPRGTKSQENIARRDIAGQGAAPLHRADGKAGKVEIARGIQARHLGRLAADQRASRLPAARGDAFDHLRGFWHGELSGGEIVEEEQRLGALADKVVDAHGNKVDADGRKLLGLDGELQLGADPVGCGHQHRVVGRQRRHAGGRPAIEQPGKQDDLVMVAPAVPVFRAVEDGRRRVGGQQPKPPAIGQDQRQRPMGGR